MYTTRRIAVLTAAALLSSCGSNSSVPQLQTSDATTANTVTAATASTGAATGTSAAAATLRQSLSVVSSDKETGASTPAVITQAAAGEVNAGPGYSDVSPHQIVRTSRNVVYIAVPACISYPTCFGNSLKMQAGNKAGNPTSFTEQDAAHHPQTSASARDAIGTSAMAIDGNDVIWVGYNTRNDGTIAVSFDTKTNLWGRSFRMGTTSAGGGWVTQGKEGVGMAVEENGKPHIVFSFIGTDKQKHIAAAQTQGSAWSAPVQIDDTKLGTGQGALHPTVAYTPKDVMLVTWLVGDENVQYNNPDGTIHVRAITSLGSSPPSVEIPDTNYQGQKGYAATVIDQGPSLLVTADGVAHISYIDTTDAIRYWSSNGTNYDSWNGSHQPAHQLTHDPSLGPDGSGGLYIYGHGTPAGGPNGHGNNLYRMHLPSGSSTWGAFEEQIVDNNLDCSVSTRWSQFFDYFPTQVDYTYWNDEYPNEEYETNH